VPGDVSINGEKLDKDKPVTGLTSEQAYQLVVAGVIIPAEKDEKDFIELIDKYQHDRNKNK
jgi:hypothetical protein